MLVSMRQSRLQARPDKAVAATGIHVGHIGLSLATAPIVCTRIRWDMGQAELGHSIWLHSKQQGLGPEEIVRSHPN